MAHPRESRGTPAWTPAACVLAVCACRGRSLRSQRARVFDAHRPLVAELRARFGLGCSHSPAEGSRRPRPRSITRVQSLHPTKGGVMWNAASTGPRATYALVTAVLTLVALLVATSVAATPKPE